MTLCELADLLCKDLVGKRCNNQDPRFIVSFEHCETKEYPSSGMLEGTYGNGKTWELAEEDYARKISGKLLVFHAYDARQEFLCPQLSSLRSREVEG